MFRGLSLLLGVSAVVAAELTCAFFGWGDPNEYRDPFISFDGVHPLFVLNGDQSRYEIAAPRLAYFAPDSFAADKRPDEFRIFCLGGSTVQGRPYSRETSFTTWLELALSAADSSRRWEVVNCGGVSYASYRLVPILDECLAYTPDLFIICTGHNEFLEDRTYAHVKQVPRIWDSVSRAVKRRRLYVLFRDAVVHLSGGESPGSSRPLPAALPAEVDVLLDYQGGLAAYHRDTDWQAGVIAHFEHNLRRMIARATAAGVPVLLIQPPSNLRDCPPFKSQHRADLTEDGLERWQTLVAQARSRFAHNVPQAIELLREAIAVDGEFAATFFELGKCYESIAQWERAREAFVAARDLDVCPLRMLTPMERIMEQVADETGVPFVNAHQLLEERARHGILGAQLLVDHIHPSFQGHQMIAEALVERMADQGFVEPASDWRTRSRLAYQGHVDSLDRFYFLKGERTLESLRAWTQGRVKAPPLESRKRPTAAPVGRNP